MLGLGSGSGVDRQAGAPESEAQLAFAWRGRAASSAVEGEGEGEGKREEEGGGEWVDTRGLLSKIVDVFMREPMDSLYRFWLASCVEAFLRGGRCVAALSASLVSLRVSVRVCLFCLASAALTGLTLDKTPALLPDIKRKHACVFRVFACLFVFLTPTALTG